MPEIMFATDGRPIQHVPEVGGAIVMTPGGFPVRAVRVIEGPSWPTTGTITSTGYPIQAVRLVNDGGLYTTDRAPTSASPEDVYTPDGNPIEAVRIFSSVPSPEVVYTADGHHIEAVRFVDAAGVPI